MGNEKICLVSANSLVSPYTCITMNICPLIFTQNAEYSGNEALFEIETLRVYAGKLPRRAHNLVIEWADAHRDELMENWERARQGLPLVDIESLE